MPTILEAPAAPAAKSSAPAAGAGVPVIGLADPPAADGPANLSGQALTSALARSSRTRRGGATEVKPKTDAPPPNGTAQGSPATAPAAGGAPGTDDTNAASPPNGEGEQPAIDPAAAADSVEALEADADRQADGAGDEDPEDPKADSKGIKSLKRRVDKLTAKLKTYEARYGSLEGGATPAAGPPIAAGAEAEHPEIAKIDGEIATYESHLSWFDQNPDGGEYRDASGRLIATIDSAKIPAMRRAAERRVAELAARRATRMDRLEQDRDAAIRQADAEAVERYPWLNNPEAPEHQQASAILAELPRNVVAALEAVPKARLLLGALVEGMRTRTAQATKPAAPRPTPPRVMAAAATAAPRMGAQDGLKAQLVEAEAALEKSGSTQDYTRVLKLRRQLRNAG